MGSISPFSFGLSLRGGEADEAIQCNNTIFSYNTLYRILRDTISMMWHSASVAKPHWPTEERSLRSALRMGTPSEWSGATANSFESGDPWLRRGNQSGR
ncbi:hypothetical protein FWH09_01840 [Candidatus Saccharibacteria bacterium]|nr:hypothetical protein [Candidatus Saccharibacteria bacterium]